MAKLKAGDGVRFVRGKTVDTGHVEGGSLKGCNGTIVGKPFLGNGVDGPKGEPRVCVAIDDDKAPRFAGFVTAPVANLEVKKSSNRRAAVAGIGPGTLAGSGILKIVTVRRGAKTFVRTVYKDGRETLDPIG